MIQYAATAAACLMVWLFLGYYALGLESGRRVSLGLRRPKLWSAFGVICVVCGVMSLITIGEEIGNRKMPFVFVPPLLD